MKIEKKYTINYIVHAISILDLDLITQILKPLVCDIDDKIELEQYLLDFKRIFSELDFEDTYFKVVHELYTREGHRNNNYTFIANYSKNHFTLNFYENIDGFIEIYERIGLTNENQIRFSSFKGNDIEAPF
jgi:hypothetical protein